MKTAATLLLAAYAAWIATNQWLTARNKLRLDLYNRRFDVYLRAMEFEQALASWVSVPAEERTAKRLAFVRAVRESRFLFADDLRITRLLEECNRRSFKVTGFEELSRHAADFPIETVAAFDER